MSGKSAVTAVVGTDSLSLSTFDSVAEAAPMVDAISDRSRICKVRFIVFVLLVIQPGGLR
jgi:hypothetical protein